MTPSSLDFAFDRAVTLFGDTHGDYEPVVAELLSSYVIAFPNHAQAWFMLGDSLRVLGRSSEALKALKRALRLSPKDKRGLIFVRLAMVFSNRGQLLAAEKWFSKAASTSYGKRKGWMWILRGVNFANREEFRRAIRCYRCAIDVKECDLDEAFLQVGHAYRAMREYKKAMTEYEKVLRIDPSNAEASRCLKGLGTLSEK